MTDAMINVLKNAFAQLARGGQARVAKGLGVRPDVVNKWALGKNRPRSDIDLRTLEKLLYLEEGTLGYPPGSMPLARSDDIAALAAEVQRQGVAIRRIEARLARREEPRSAPRPPRSREAVPTARRGKVDP